MKSTLRLAVFAALACAAACGNSPARRTTTYASDHEPTRYTYRVVAEYTHATDAYTQGLDFHEGALWEGTGEYGHSEIRLLDPQQGTHKTIHQTPASEFGEGITILDGKLYQLTWESNTCHVYDLKSGRKLRDFHYAGEGWGLTTDGTKLYLSNGSANLYRIDPASFRRERTVTVTWQGTPVRFLNELEWIEGKIWANVYTTDQIIIIDPETGRVEGVVDLSGLLPDNARTPLTDVLNGIAYDEQSKRILVTGKRWPKLYEIELIKQ